MTMKPDKGQLIASIGSLLCWLTVIDVSLRVSFLPIYLTVTPERSHLLAGQDWSLLFVLNGLPILLFWYATRYLPLRGAVMFVMLFVLDVFIYASMGKVRVLVSPVVYSDISRLAEAIHVRSAAAEMMTPVDNLRFINLLVPLIAWRHLKRRPLPFGPGIGKSRKRIEAFGLAVFCAAAAYFVFVSVPVIYGSDAAGVLSSDYANAGTPKHNTITSMPHDKLEVNEYGIPVDPPDPYLWDKGNLAYYAADPFYCLKDFATYGPLFSFMLSAREQFAIDRELKRSAPDVASVRSALGYLSSVRHEGNFKGAWRNSSRPNVIVILEESMGRAAFDAPVFRGTGRKVAPFTESLKGEAVFTWKAFSPVLGWETPQSELMVLCSALPSGVLDKYGIVYTSHMDHDYVSLPRVLRSYGYHTAVFHPFDRNTWQRVNAFKRLGFERYDSAGDFEKGRNAGLGMCDEDFFRQTAGKLRSLPEPYFAFIITLSGHAPFDVPENMKSGVTSGMDGIDPYAGKYFEAMNYADRALESFWEETADIRQHSITVVFGDHQGLVSVEQYRSVGYSTGDEDTVLRHQVPIVISAPFMKGRVKPLDGVVADLSAIAPTVLDMLDIPVPQCFVGSSLFGGKVAAMDGVGDVMDNRRVCNYTRGSYFDYVSGKPIARSDCEDLLKEADAARVVSADVIWGKGYSYAGRPVQSR